MQNHLELIQRSKAFNNMRLQTRDMNLVRDWLYLGCQAAEQGPIQELKALGITHVVQVGASAFMTPSHKEELRYCCIQAMDHEGEDLLAKLKQQDVHGFISQAKEEGGIVLVHCLAGVSRSATTVISWLMTEECLSFEEALTDVISRRACVTPNRGFCDQLTILQDKCDSRLENYTTKMFRDLKEVDEMTLGKWLVLLERARGNARERNGTDRMEGEGGEEMRTMKLSLGGFAQRLEERKRKGYAGEYKGFSPPAETIDGE